jgi:hypothetical protein
MRLVPRCIRRFKSSLANSASTNAALRTTRARPEPEFALSRPTFIAVSFSAMDAKDFAGALAQIEAELDREMA